MKKKPFILIAIVVLLVFAVLFVYRFQKAHTFKLSNDLNDHTLKIEQIQPIYGSVRVRGDADTDVEFTDIETGKTYTIGYITHGISEKMKLEKGKWYTVKGGGNITVKPVNVRIVD